MERGQRIGYAGQKVDLARMKWTVDGAVLGIDDERVEHPVAIEQDERLAHSSKPAFFASP
jgi:hypothetical protein